MEALPKAVFFSQNAFIATWANSMALMSRFAPDSRTVSTGEAVWEPGLPPSPGTGTAGRTGSSLEGCSPLPGAGTIPGAAWPGRQRTRDNETRRASRGQGRLGRQGRLWGESRERTREAGPARRSREQLQVPGRPLPYPGGGRRVLAGASRFSRQRREKKKKFLARVFLAKRLKIQALNREEMVTTGSAPLSF